MNPSLAAIALWLGMAAIGIGVLGVACWRLSVWAWQPPQGERSAAAPRSPSLYVRRPVRYTRLRPWLIAACVVAAVVYALVVTR